MRILNITPDSFSDGGFFNQQKNLQEALLNKTGLFSILDFGAESTAPMNQGITDKEELDRFKSVGLFELDFPQEIVLSFDTYKPQVFFEIYEKLRSKGVQNEIWWNDVSGVVDEEVKRFLVKTQKTKYVFCHNLISSREKTSEHMNAVNDELTIEDIFSYFVEGERSFSKNKDRVIFDPCFGFAKNRQQNIDLLNNLPLLMDKIDFLWLIGISRKSFLRPVGKKLSDPGVKDFVKEKQRIFLKKLLENSSSAEMILRIHDEKDIEGVF